MVEFIPGQRWINNAQLQMGLGTVVSTDFRTVTLIFMAVGETFIYAKESVPLTRVKFSPGDHIITDDNLQFEVLSVRQQDNMFYYGVKDADGNDHEVAETSLNNLIQLNRPTERLFNGLVDRDAWFEVRYQTQKLISENANDPMRGLIGGRVSLLPHQLYIANEVANRYAPRVLLADEVGLGKTIEAGMILHHQLVTERAQRVLIVVPESLVHQWLVEMLRKFNLHFKIFDADRIASLTESDGDDDLTAPMDIIQENPFLSEQLVLCSLEFLCSRPDYYKQCRDGSWDLLVVDEAHHLEWSEDDPGFEYQLIEQLAKQIKGILLLTATPEQLGKSSHFARLRLLDGDRFHDYQQFVAEEADYQPIAQAVETLLDPDATLDHKQIELIESKLGTEAKLLIENLSVDDVSDQQPAGQQIIEKLVDHHGTGRVLFRNTRSAVKGFPQREVHHYPLPLPVKYQDAFAEIAGVELSEMQLLLCPELLYQAIVSTDNWTNVDPRVEALGEILVSKKRDKILVITASAVTALDLAEWLRVEKGILAAVFHEGMSLIERDRAAAWFADQISGTQVLICSEIGSEGRNFQFSHHLVLFDLPLNPDLLEQRIGRLDRIGQTETIHIHVLYLENTAQEFMFHWYQKGLNAFSKTCPVGHAVFAKVKEDVTKALHHPEKADHALIDVTAIYYQELTQALERGRDRLLEFNSCRPERATQLRDEAEQQDQTDTLQQYMETVFDCFGVDHEVHSEGCYAINPGTHMAMPFPQLPEEGMTITYSRDIALAYEDVSFITWDHPLVTGTMDLVLAGEVGNTAVIAAPIEGVARGTILLESIFILESASTQIQQSNRYLPATTIRTLIDQTGKRHEDKPSYRTIDMPGERIKPEMVRRLLNSRDGLLRKMVAASEQLAKRKAPTILTQAVGKSKATLEKEIARLQSLVQVNPNVREEEILFYQQQLASVTARLEDATVRLDALRIIVAT